MVWKVLIVGGVMAFILGLSLPRPCPPAGRDHRSAAIGDDAIAALDRLKRAPCGILCSTT